MNGSAAASRVLVHLKSTPGESPVLARFTESLIGALGAGDNEDVVRVTCQRTADGKVVLGRGGDEGLLLKRPPQCPIKLLTQDQARQLPDDVLCRGVAVGVVALVESCDGHVLVTRRAKHMRTFPGVWVPPGGSVEGDESLQETALRELKEETGLDVSGGELVESEPLCLWESVYPPFLERGLPKRHHVVVYFHVRLASDCESLDGRLALEPDEVDASAWLNREQVGVVVNGPPLASAAKKAFKMKVLGTDGSLSSVDCPSEVLLAKAPASGVDVERVSSGTIFALSQWLKKMESKV